MSARKANESKRLKFCIIIQSAEAETVWNAFRFATTALIYDNDVTVFLLGLGVEAPTIGTLKFDVKSQIDTFRENGGMMIGCGVCCETRRDSMPMLEEQLSCELGSMQTLYSLTADADKVFTF